MPPSFRNRIVSLTLLALAVAGGLSVLALRPVFASATPTLAPGESIAVPFTAPPALPPRQGGSADEAPRPSGLVAATAGTLDDVAEPAGFLIARVTAGTVQLRAAPGKGVVAEVGTTTEFASPMTLGVVERRDNWVGVVSPELANGQVGWIDLSAGGVELSTTELRISIDLSRRELVLKRGDEVLRRMTVGVGQPGSPTPTGRFAVTDKLAGAGYSTSYGCCIIALSARQPNPPPGWEGGDRIAIHGTNDPSTIGAATSAGCPHASDEDLRFLMQRVPLGTPAVVHP